MAREFQKSNNAIHRGSRWCWIARESPDPRIVLDGPYFQELEVYAFRSGHDSFYCKYRIGNESTEHNSQTPQLHK